MRASRWSDDDAAAVQAAAPGVLRRDPATRAEFSEDFGHLIRAEPRAVASPRTVEELAAVVRCVAERKLALCARGRGYSQSGQSLSPSGLALDLSRLDRIEAVSPDGRQAHCEPCARWRELTAATLQKGFVPRVLPLNLDISVGGLISAGGIGANSHQYGPLVSQVAELRVVTSAGGLSNCSATVEPDLFFAILAGLGRCGIIARASIKLRPAPARVRTIHLVYGDIETWMADQQRIVNERRAHYLEAMCWMGAKGFRGGTGGRPRRVQWLYGLQVGIEYDQKPPDEATILASLTPWRVPHVDDEGFADFIARYQPRFDAMRQTGAWQQLHPWLECLLAPATVVSLLPGILDELPISLGDGHRLIWVDTRNKPPFLAAPEGSPAVCLAILPTGVPASEREQVIPALARVDRGLRASGGKRYLSGWLGQMGPARWREHYGQQYERWVALKDRFDPERLFCSALFPDG
jgi:cytokinin dehydrogenase